MGDPMAKRIERNGKFFRIRKGREVEIPFAWVGKVALPQTIRKRKVLARTRGPAFDRWGRNSTKSFNSDED